MRQKIREWIAEPYIQFLLTGLVIYFLYGISGSAQNRQQQQKKEIVVTSGMQQHLKDIFQNEWQRTPTKEELALSIERYYDEEMMLEEALALHLERRDPAIKKALLTKMHQIILSSLSVQEPDEAALYRYYRAHIDRYSQVETIHFVHIFALEAHRKGLDQWAEILKNHPIMPKKNMAYGDSFPEGNDIGPVSMDRVATLFGRYFAHEISGMPEQQWFGPVRSSKGFHMVYIVQKGGGKPLAFDEVESRVYRDFLAEKREKGMQVSMRKIARSYRRKVE